MVVVETAWRPFQRLTNHAYVKYLKMLEIQNCQALAVKFVDVLAVILRIKNRNKQKQLKNVYFL